MDFSTKGRFPQNPRPAWVFTEYASYSHPIRPAPARGTIGRAQAGGLNKISVRNGLALQSAILAMTTFPADIVFNHHPARVNSTGGRSGA